MKDTSYMLIELMLRQMIKKYRDDPKRSVRNLIDMALNFAKGRFQRSFFEAAHSMLNNEDSAYYKLLDNVLMNVDTERLLTVGMNIGYNSCTRGAEVIRATEAASNFDIPWSMTLELSEDSEEYSADYARLVEEGKELGIYTWLLFAEHRSRGILDIASSQPECAFVLFCEPEIVTEELLDEISPLRNLALCVRYTGDTKAACERICSRGMISSVFVRYNDENVGDLASGAVIADIERIAPMLCVLAAERDCSPEARKKAAEYARSVRLSQKYPFVIWEYIQDGMFVDTIISEDPCSAYFDSEGDFHALFHSYPDGADVSERNFRRSSLRSILSSAFYKNR